MKLNKDDRNFFVLAKRVLKDTVCERRLLKRKYSITERDVEEVADYCYITEDYMLALAEIIDTALTLNSNPHLDIEKLKSTCKWTLGLSRELCSKCREHYSKEK